MSLFLHPRTDRDAAAAALDRARDHLRQAIDDAEFAAHFVRISEVEVMAAMWDDHIEKLDAYVGKLQ